MWKSGWWVGAISMAPTAGGALTSVSLVGGESEELRAAQFLYREGGELFTSLSHSSLAQTEARLSI